MLGGSCRATGLFAEQMTDRLAESLGNRAEKRSHTSPLPGGEKRGRDAAGEARGIDRGGSGASRLSPRQQCPRGRRPHAKKARRGDPWCAAVNRSWRPRSATWWSANSRALADVARRTRLGFGICGGMRCAGSLRAIVAEMTGTVPAEGPGLAWTSRSSTARRWPPSNPLQLAGGLDLLVARCGARGEAE